MIYRGFKYKLSPTVDQEQMFRRFGGVCRLIYNLALEQRVVWGKSHKIDYVKQCSELTKLRAKFDFVRAVSSSCQQQTLRDLDKAFVNFFKDRAHYPVFRKRSDGDSFRFQGREASVQSLNSKWTQVKLPKIGWVKFRQTRPMTGRLLNVTVSRDALGWHISFAREIEHETPRPLDTSVGIDRGVATTLALSTGEMLTMPSSLARIEQQKRQAQRVVARRRKGSKRRQRAQARVARLAARQGRIRRDFHHRVALDVARRFGTVVLEDLKTRAMTASARGTIEAPGRNVRAKSGLNRSILNAGWHQFEVLLRYKVEERGGQVVKVPAGFTSQECASCGVVDARSRKSQAVFHCVSCGHQAHADINAAVVIERRWSTPLLDVEGLHKHPCEASTGRGRKTSENLKASA